MERRVALLFAPLVGLACSDPERQEQDDVATPPGLTSGSRNTNSGGASGGSGGGAGATGAEAGEEGEDSGVRFDVSEEEGVGGGDDLKGCGKVDFLFVIDNSGSMGDNQTSLINSFPGFLNTMRTELKDAQDYHVMVTDTGFRAGASLLCGFYCLSREAPVETGGDELPPICPFDFTWNCDNPPIIQCDNTLGSGSNFPKGDDASNAFCRFETGGERWTTGEEPGLPGKFSCAAKVGTDGSGSERPMQSLIAALSDEMNAPAGCNAGFLRDDAILVVTVITDESDSDSTGNPQQWFSQVVAAKNGNEDAVVMLGLIPAQGADRQTAFMNNFTHSIIEDVNASNYAPFFSRAVDIIDTSCTDFVPPG